ncbi:Uncharacterized protein At5g39865 [Linum grandiflorum]
MKGKLLKKLNSIKPVAQLKQPALVLQPISVHNFQSPPQNPPVKPPTSEVGFSEPYIEDGGMNLDDGDGDFGEDKENLGRPPLKALFPSAAEQTPLSEIDISSFRRPDFDSVTLFDPNLLAAFEKALSDYIRWIDEERRARKQSVDKRDDQGDKKEEPLPKDETEEEETGSDPLLRFEDKCPPGGADTVILYTTTLRGIRKTFEDCSGVRFLLQSLRIRYRERDVSMHREYREELWRVLGGKTMPPRLFVKGKYIGGAEEVLGLNEQGKFRPLFAGIPADDGLMEDCEACNGVRFVLCFNCSGSHRVLTGDDWSWSECVDCNENGLIVCRHCCC